MSDYKPLSEEEERRLRDAADADTLQGWALLQAYGPRRVVAAIDTARARLAKVESERDALNRIEEKIIAAAGVMDRLRRENELLNAASKVEQAANAELSERLRRAERVLKQIAELPVGQYEGPYGEACDCPECVGVRATARDAWAQAALDGKEHPHDAP